MTATWHVDAPQLAAYLAGRVDATVAASVESHLLACSRCRDDLAAADDLTDREASWAALERRVDAEAAGPLVRVARRAGLSDADAQLVAPTAPLRWAWLAGTAVALVVAAALAERDTGLAVSVTRLAFLIVAPLVPLAAVVSAVSTASEPAPVLARATPLSRLRIGALRAGVALATALMVGVAASAAVPGPWTRISLWLLPSFALAGLGALWSRVAAPATVVAGLAAAWVGLVVVAARVADDRLAAFGAGPQIAYLVVAVGCAAVLVLRPSLAELRESP